MICSTAIRAVILATAMGVLTPAFAQDVADDSADVPLSVTAPAVEIPENTALAAPDLAQSVAIEHVDILVENEPVSVRLQRTELDGVLIEASPIFAQLKGEASAEGTVLSYLRFQDGAELTLDVADGKVRANGLVLGALPDFQPREKADTWLSLNAISVLTGTQVSENTDGGWTFTLDDRLRPKFDLNLFVNGEQVDVSLVEPRTIGPVLLVPLEAVVDALGHELRRPDANTVEITRIQDSATLSLDLSTGLVSVNNIPRGVTPNIAYVDPATLLLPFTAVETLTGTHITLEPGSNRVIVELDDRLAGGALPGERVVDEAASTGLTPESLEFQISDRGPAIAQFNSRIRNYNSQLRYESAGGVTSPEELVPGWISLDVQSLDGWVGSVGDANTRFRELGGVDENRIRGLTFRRQNQENGRLLALAAGTTLSGAEQITDNASRPTFAGAAAGARLISGDGQREIGLSIAGGEAGVDDRAVLSAQAEFNWPEREKGLKGAFVAGDLGVFNGPAGTGVDGRARAQARIDINRQFGFQGNLSYDGARFRQSRRTGDVPDFEGALSGTSGARFVGTVSTDWRSVKNWGPITRVATGLQANVSHTEGAGGETSVTVVGSASAQIAEAGFDIGVDIGHTEIDRAGENTSIDTINVRAFKRFNWGTLQATYSNSDSEDGNNQRFVSTLQVNPLRKALGRGATVTAGPSATAVWTPEQSSFRAGATVSANSGRAFGERFNLQGQISALQSVDPNTSGTSFLGNITGRFNITRLIQLEANYFDTFDGQRDVSVGLRGRVNFNGPRKHTRPRDGRGVLRGQVFFDRNRDGIRQDDEPGLPGIRVMVTGTRLALGADRDGNFTIQNMKPGLYGLAVDRRSLPLGLLVPEASASRATIAPERITDLDIPIIASGQIRGTVFVDENASGDVDPGEQRLEGSYLTLTPANEDEAADPVTTLSASFGQYSFENLSPGTYELSTNHKGIVYSQTVELTEENLFSVTPFALPGSTGPPPDPGQLTEDVFEAPVVGEA